MAATRFLHFATLTPLFGGAFFAAALAPPPLGAELARRQRAATSALALAALASAAAWFYLVARGMNGGAVDWDELEDVAFATAFGPAWLLHIAALVALLAAVRASAIVVAALSGLAVASLALTGHAAMQTGALGALHRANHALHLLATAGWLGGLPPFVRCLALAAATPARRDALAAMKRYSRIGHFAVPLVLISGTLDAALTTGLPPWRALTPYRVGLLVKVGLFLAMTALALFNRYVLAPDAGRDAGAARRLAAGAMAEFALGLAALADVSQFAMREPS